MKQKSGTLQDLKANRQGEMMPAQERIIRAERWNRCGDAFVYFAICAIIIVGIFYAITGRGFDSRDLLAITGVTAIPFLVITFLTQWRKYQSDLVNKTVASETGNVSLDIKEKTSGRSTYTLRLGELHWKVSKEEFLSFSNGEVYRVYFAPRTKVLLSYERLVDHRDLAEIAPEAVDFRKQRRYTLSGDGELVEVDENNQAMKHDAVR